MTPIAAFRRALEETIGFDDEVVVVFSGLWSFGHCLGVSPRDIPAAVLDVLVEVVGARTLVLPAYTLAFPRSKQFDLRRSQPETGILPAHALATGLFQRTSNPMNSYLVYGPQSSEILSRKETTSWGDDSVMAWFGQTNARLLILGERWHRACSFYHRAEEILQVPYRYYKRFNGTMIDMHDEKHSCSVVMYVRPFEQPFVNDYTKVQPILARSNTLAVAGDPTFPIESARAADVLNACIDLLTADPYAYVANADDVRGWISGGGKQKEIDAILPEQQVRNV